MREERKKRTDTALVFTHFYCVRKRSETPSHEVRGVTSGTMHNRSMITSPIEHWLYNIYNATKIIIEIIVK